MNFPTGKNDTASVTSGDSGKAAGKVCRADPHHKVSPHDKKEDIFTVTEKDRNDLNPEMEQEQLADDAPESLAFREIDAEVNIPPQERIERLKKENAELFKSNAELEARVQLITEEAARAKADLYNFRQRSEKDRLRQRKQAVENAVKGMLPVLDGFDMALAASSSCGREEEDPVLAGFRMVQRQFLAALADLGLEAVDAEGQAFDPALHEALAVCPVSEPEQDGLVLAQIRRGFALDGKTVRAAQVQVGRYEE